MKMIKMCIRIRRSHYTRNDPTYANKMHWQPSVTQCLIKCALLWFCYSVWFDFWLQYTTATAAAAAAAAVVNEIDHLFDSNNRRRWTTCPQAQLIPGHRSVPLQQNKAKQRKPIENNKFGAVPVLFMFIVITYKYLYYFFHFTAWNCSVAKWLAPPTFQSWGRRFESRYYTFN